MNDDGAAGGRVAESETALKVLLYAPAYKETERNVIKTSSKSTYI